MRTGLRTLGVAIAILVGGMTSVSAAPAPTVDLQLTMTDSPDPVVEGRDLTYRITVKNKGKATATGVTVTDRLSAPLVSSSSSQGSCDATVVCSLGSLARGASASVTIVVKADADYPSNTALASSNEPDQAPANNSATVSTTIQPDPLAPQVFVAPYASASEHEDCSGPVSADDCSAEASASVSGALSSSSIVDTVEASTEDRYALASGINGVDYELREPARSVTVSADLALDSATAEATVAGFGWSEARYEIFASFNRCTDCSNFASLVLVDDLNGLPGGNDTRSEELVTLTLEITSASGMVPAGAIHIDARLLTLARLSGGAGRVAADASGTVERIVVTPHR
jgi:uncharacterized repeat protein (TIGR01451 family)